MHPQLAVIAAELESARTRLDRLAESLPDDRWPVRPAPDRWSVSECIEHLNLTSRAFVPPLRAALEEARSSPGRSPRRYHRGVLGWLLWRTMGPPTRMKVRTAPGFVPGSVASPAELRAEFHRLQDEQMDCARAGDGLPLQRVRIASPFDPRVSYNVFAALSILPRHQHRHLWQAEQVVRSLR